VEVGLMARRREDERDEKKPRMRLFAIDPSHASKLVGIALAMAVIVLLNMVAGRRFTRWDFTSNKRYSLSTATLQTLHDLPDTVQIWVLLGNADPLEQSVKQLVVAYQAETSKLDVHYVDPDRDTIALEDVRKRFKIETGRTEEGHIVADAVVVVARGEKRWFITSSEMVESVASDETKVRPREERALTGAIRNVLGGTKTKVCFTSGHGELNPLDVSDRGAGVLKTVLEKDNYEVATVDLAAPNATKPLEGCGVAIAAGLRAPFAKEEAERLRTWVLEDGNLFLAASPVIGAADDPQNQNKGALVPVGLERVLGPFGIALDDDVVTEQEADVALPDSGGFRFVAQPRQHSTTQALIKTANTPDVSRVVLDLTRSLSRKVEPGAVTPTDLLVTSARAFGLRTIEGAADWRDAPQKHPGDFGGPLTVGMAAERPKANVSSPHGARIVVVGTASMLSSASFREPQAFRGAAYFAESSISWLATKPQVLDVPEKAAVGAAMRLDEDSRGSIRRYVVLFMPATVALLGIAIAVFRRAGEGRTKTKRR
jgi:hypothetical protein